MGFPWERTKGDSSRARLETWKNCGKNSPTRRIIPLCLVSDNATVAESTTHLSVASSDPPWRRSPAQQIEQRGAPWHLSSPAHCAETPASRGSLPLMAQLSPPPLWHFGVQRKDTSSFCAKLILRTVSRLLRILPNASQGGTSREQLHNSEWQV
jgi:hypothetical protein